MFLIFGSSGFIGNYLQKALIKNYDKDSIISIGRKNSNLNIDLKNFKNFNKIPEKNYECVYALAGNSDFNIDKKKETQQIKTNEKIMNNVIKFCKINKVKKIIFFSSSAVYSEKNFLPFNERQTINPTNSLGISKYHIERKLKKKFLNSKTKVIILRIFTVYGKNMRKNQFLNQAIKKFKSKKKNLIFYNKNTLRNFIHVEDLINILLELTYLKAKKFSVYNVGSTKSIKIISIINFLNKISKQKKKIIFKSNNNNLSHLVNIRKLNKLYKFKLKNFYKELNKIYEQF